MQGRGLLPLVSDDRTRARFLIGEAFQGWARNRSDSWSLDDDRPRAAGREALEIARRLDDAALQSAALDALSVNDLNINDYRSSLVAVDERLELGSRLDFIERLDARTMVAWHQTILGELGASLAFATETLAGLSPGQAPPWSMSNRAWLIADLHALGRWDEVSGEATQMLRIWEDLERPPAGFAIQGFMAAFDVARARADEDLGERCREALERILAEFAEDDRIGRLRAWVRLDLDALVDEVIAPLPRGRRPDRSSRPGDRRLRGSRPSDRRGDPRGTARLRGAARDPSRRGPGPPSARSRDGRPGRARDAPWTCSSRWRPSRMRRASRSSSASSAGIRSSSRPGSPASRRSAISISSAGSPSGARPARPRTAPGSRRVRRSRPPGAVCDRQSASVIRNRWVSRADARRGASRPMPFGS